MSGSHLPTELWLLILEHATILRPCFLTDLEADLVKDPDAIKDWIRDPGYEFHKQWVILRRVCRSWKVFMDRADIKFRFVRTYNLSSTAIDNSPDVLAGTGIMQAVRIEGAGWPAANSEAHFEV